VIQFILYSCFRINFKKRVERVYMKPSQKIMMLCLSMASIVTLRANDFCALESGEAEKCEEIAVRAPRPGGELIASQGVVGPCVICPSIDPELILELQNQSGSGVSGPETSTVNAVARYANTAGTELKNSAVLVDDAGNVTLEGITKGGNTVSWPSNVGAAGTFLGSDGAGNLIYATPAGSGNVSAAVPFTTNNRIVTVDLPSGAHNVKESTAVTLDNSNNISGVNILTATTVNAPTLNGNATSATDFLGELEGDVTGVQGATVVSFVGGETAADVAAATVLANAATSANTENTLVLRDASGDFSAGTITAALVGAASLNVLKSGDTMTGRLTLPAGSIAAPSLHFSGSVNTGMTAEAGNILSLVTGGVERLQADGLGNVLFQCDYKMRAYRSSIQSIINTTATIVFNTESFDPSNSYDNTTGVFTAPADGMYWVSVTLTSNANASTTVTAAVVVNGTPVPGTAMAESLPNGSIDITMGTSVLLELNAGDLVRVDLTTPGGIIVESDSTQLSIHYASMI
jgi:hypothetical protein